MDKDEFEKLRAQWYEKLAQSGFKDREDLIDGELKLQEEAPFIRYKCMPPHIKAAKGEYYQVINNRVNDDETKFRNETDRYVMMRHSEGAQIKQITDELNILSAERDRKTIRIMIRRYEMAWGLKSYTRKELNLKDE